MEIVIKKKGLVPEIEVNVLTTSSNITEEMLQSLNDFRRDHNAVKIRFQLPDLSEGYLTDTHLQFYPYRDRNNYMTYQRYNKSQTLNGDLRWVLQS